ncbi:MAG: apolipoprotein N-acyltransferase [Candidatus Omnitrophica bacterium]|nr:apolipoprotein N-acyltransferase [Candidatus Omnitrophota bacterium]MDD5770627.1 apolipoprotein N-acyltransferase [Candidatus Omnitrophota bacterium]
MTPVILSVLSAVLLSLSFSSFNLWLLAWVGFIPLLISLENGSVLRSFFVAYLWGVIFWVITIYWLVHVTLLGQAILILYLALYSGLFGCLVYLCRSYPVRVSLFFIPASWVLLEYLRSYLFTGFPWALMGLSQYRNLALIQISDITGSWGVSFLVIMVNAGIYFSLRRRLKKTDLLICLSILFLSAGYGFYRLSHRPELRMDKEWLKVSVIQGNIPQELKWDKGSASGILDDYLELSRKAAGEDNPGLIIWPEASVPFVWGDRFSDTQFRRIFSLAKDLKTALLVGSLSRLGVSYFNSALFVDKFGQPEKIYNKIHLVPFGEFVPLKDVFPFLRSIAPIGDIEPGREPVVFASPADFSVLICFEDLFPELSREFVKKGARFLVNITNDAWYKKSSAPYQHLAASVFRAVENRVNLVRSANTGISGFIDPCGRLSSTVQDRSGRQIFVRGYNSKNLCLLSQGRTVYNHYGDIFILLCLSFEIYSAVIYSRKRLAARPF